MAFPQEKFLGPCKSSRDFTVSFPEFPEASLRKMYLSIFIWF